MKTKRQTENPSEGKLYTHIYYDDNCTRNQDNNDLLVDSMSQ